ncbi:hypothetical protein [Rubinisphaera margarita]|uniref:hypothetical protein n=1 Tax=Rubinisphaera margarita TaxID=2909586 RepID=UPI001EE8973F|nr:hypothetical protein [Rubinisphaera margarita]MCG6154813.1 hypothetical protein [Rubinisphaera margarita]
MDSVDAINACDSGTTSSVPVLLIRLSLLYAIVAFCCWNELRFQSGGVEIPGEIVSTSLVHQSKGDRLRVQYTYQNPETGQPMTHTTTLGARCPAQAGSTTVDFLGGSIPQSRLVLERRPWIISFFVWFNVAIASVVVGTIGYVIWDYHRIPDGHLSPKERALARFHRRRRTEQALKV